MVGRVDGQMQGDDGIATVNIRIGLVIVTGLGVSDTVPFVLFAGDGINVHLVSRDDRQVEGDHAVTSVCSCKGLGKDAGIGVEAVAPKVLPAGINADFIRDLRSHKQMQRNEAIASGGRKSVDDYAGLTRCDKDLVDIVVLVTGVLAGGVVDVLLGIVFVDGHSQRGEVALTSGEIVEKTDVESAGFVDSGVVMVVFSQEVAVLVIPAIE